MSQLLFSGENLCLERSGRALFTGLNFSLSEGELLYLTGANGCGKTSLLRALAGLTPFAQGLLFWQGNACTPRSEDLTFDRLYLGHQPPLKAELTALENFQLLAPLWHIQADTAAMIASLTWAGLGKRLFLPTQKLSQGQRRRIMLAICCHAPQKLWLLDEPSTALDSDGQALLASLITAHCARGGIALMATHQSLPHHLPNQRTLALGTFAPQPSS